MNQSINHSTPSSDAAPRRRSFSWPLILGIILTLSLAAIITILALLPHDSSTPGGSSSTATSAQPTLTNLAASEVTFPTDGKVNLYIFWGDGCPHCKELLAYLQTVDSDLGQYYNLNSFEVWYHDDSQKLMQEFGDFLGQKASSIPFIIVGDQVLYGFGSGQGEKLSTAIKSAAKDPNYKDQFQLFLEQR